MGQYYTAVNIDKHDVLFPSSFDGGWKLTESCYVGNWFTDALTSLLAGSWHGGRVMFVGDYAWAEAVEEGRNGCSGAALLRSLRQSGDLTGDPVVDADENDAWLSAARYFRRCDLGLSEARRLTEDGRLVRKSFRYVINEDRGVFYDRKSCPVALTWTDDEGHEHKLSQDPLLIFLAVGNGLGGGDYRSEQAQELVGSWACQAITASNERPEGLREIVNPFDPKA